MTHGRERIEEEIEELAEALWTLGEEGRNRVEDLDASPRLPDPGPALREVEARGLAWVEDGRIYLTAQGRALAQGQIRRHRLAEVLFTTVLDVKDEMAVDRTACAIEHALGAAVTDSVCAFLGHPKFCPHGKPIPAGPCCRSFSDVVEPLVQPLSRMPVATAARIVYVVPREPQRLVRLSGLGIVPGATIRLRQKSPAVVIQVGETTVALDPEIASEVFVKKIEAG